MSSDLFKVQLSFPVKTKRPFQARALVASESFFLMKLTLSCSLRFWTAVSSVFYFFKKILTGVPSCLIILIPLQCLFSGLTCTWLELSPLSVYMRQSFQSPVLLVSLVFQIVISVIFFLCTLFTKNKCQVLLPACPRKNSFCSED